MELSTYTNYVDNKNINPFSYQELLSVITNSSKLGYKMADIQTVKAWNFPNGSIYVILFSNTNAASTYVTLHNFGKLTFLGSTVTPVGKGNMYLNYVEVSYFLYLTLYSQYQSTSMIPKLIANIVFFEYSMDSSM